MIAGVRDDAWRRRNPSHPGEAIRLFYLESVEDDAERLTVGEAAAKLGVSRAALSNVIHGKAAVSLKMALKLEAVGWGIADSWIRWQARYDLAQARKRLNQPKPQIEDTLPDVAEAA